jgi:hypothetical protein
MTSPQVETVVPVVWEDWEVQAFEEEAYMRGVRWALDAVVSSLQMYPNGGGDTRVMAEVERLLVSVPECDPLCRHCAERRQAKQDAEDFTRDVDEGWTILREAKENHMQKKREAWAEIHKQK